MSSRTHDVIYIPFLCVGKCVRKRIMYSQSHTGFNKIAIQNYKFQVASGQ